MAMAIETEEGVIEGLSIIDRLLPLWILLAMLGGFLLGQFEGIKDIFNEVQFGTVSLPIAVGLMWMMYPVLAKVKYEELRKVLDEGKMFGTSLLLNWLIGPLIMFLLAWLFLPNEPAFREGIIMVGLARCIAMVLIWNMMAGGDAEDCAVLVALNSVFQVLAYSFYAFFFLTVASEWLGGEGTAVDITMVDIAISVFIFLGIPLLAGALTRLVGLRTIGKDRYDTKFAPRLGPTALVGLLFTIVVMFAMQGKEIIKLGWKLGQVAGPLLLYFLLMFSVAFLISWLLKFAYDKTVTLSFTAASNNFELAIAVAVGTWGIESRQALAAVIGPLVEVPVLIALVYLSLWAKKYFFTEDGIPKAFGAPIAESSTVD